LRLNKRLFLPRELGFGSLGSLGWLRNGAGGGVGALLFEKVVVGEVVVVVVRHMVLV